MKSLGESQMYWIIPRQFIRVGKATSQSAAIKDVSINRSVFVSVRGARGQGIALIMVQENPVVANEGESIRCKQELAGINLRSRSAFEAKISVGIESPLGVVGGDFDTILVSLGIVKRREDQSRSKLAFVN